MNRAVVAACLVAGCASGRTASDIDASVGGNGGPDAKIYLDGQIEGTPDARPDAAAVVPPDAYVPDAYVCVPMAQQLLSNPVLDLNPAGTGWVLQNIDNAAPIVTDADGIAEHSAPYKAWLGGLEASDYGVTSVTDVLYQDVTIPVGTTALRLTAQYAVGGVEETDTVYDTAQVALVQTNGTPIEVVKSLSNTMPTAAWTAIDHTFTNASALAGMTVRLRMTSTNDVINWTNFYFDTFALTATVCQ